MTNLSDTQRVLLSSASQRESGSILPLPATLAPGGGTTKAIDALLKRGFAEERETSDAAAVRREDGDLRYGVFITSTGAEVIGVELLDGGAADFGGDGDGDGAAETASPAPPAAKVSKTSAVLTLLNRPTGATLAELIEATGWLPHTTRAALTGIRKKGHEVTRGKRGDATCYFVAEAA